MLTNKAQDHQPEILSARRRNKSGGISSIVEIYLGNDSVGLIRRLELMIFFVARYVFYTIFFMVRYILRKLASRRTGDELRQPSQHSS